MTTTSDCPRWRRNLIDVYRDWRVRRDREAYVAALAGWRATFRLVIRRMTLPMSRASSPVGAADGYASVPVAGHNGLSLTALAIYQRLRPGNWHPSEFDGNRKITEEWYAKIAQAAAEAVQPTAGEPEARCHRCLGPNVSWLAPSPLWNEVMRDGDINGPWQYGEIICPTCFAVLAELAGVASGCWQLRPDVVHVTLQTVTPSGRVWDEETKLWREPLGSVTTAAAQPDSTQPCAKGDEEARHGDV
jgi:hypothetical protein